MSAPIVIEPYNSQWPELYEAEKAIILAAIGEQVVGIEHVGSTAVSGLAAKPVIDIMVGIRRLEDAAFCMAPLANIGYQYLPEYEASIPERRFFRKGPLEARTHHLHMVEMDGEFWVRHLLFRDYLRDHPATARAYEDLKRELAVVYRLNRDGYSEAKTAFVTDIEARARAEKARQDDGR